MCDVGINHINQSMKIDDRIDKLKWNNENLMRNTVRLIEL